MDVYATVQILESLNPRILILQILSSFAHMKLPALLRSLSKQDWHWLSKLVGSPLYNRHAAVVRLFEYLRKKAPASAEQLPEVKILHRAVFPGETFDAAKVHHANNYLLRLTEEYLAWDTWWQDEPERQFSLLLATRRRGLDRHFREVLQRLRLLRDAQPLRHAAHYRFEYRMALEDYQHSMQSGRTTVEHLQPLSDWHDVAFVAEKLRNACILVSRQRVLRATELDTGLLPAVLDFVQSRPQLLDYPAVAVYYHGYQALTNPLEDQHFFALKRQLAAAASAFPLTEWRDVYLLAINFCIHRINLRQAQYLREVFDLYQSGLATGVFLENNAISRFTYTNIALAALRLGEYNWVWDFLHQYRDKLPDTQRAGAFAFNLARYYCERGDYDRAMPLLLEMDFDDVLHNLTAKAMLLRMYYETHATDALFSLLTSLGTYLRRKRQVSEQQRTAYQNLIRFVRRLAALSVRDHAGRQALRQEVELEPLLAEKDWLVRMLEK
jgi:hypothetical protein